MRLPCRYAPCNDVFMWVFSPSFSPSPIKGEGTSSRHCETWFFEVVAISRVIFVILSGAFPREDLIFLYLKYI
jgi:hypothetical protein